MPGSPDDRWDRYRMEVASGREEMSADVDIVYTIDKPFDKPFELKGRMPMEKDRGARLPGFQATVSVVLARSSQLREWNSCRDRPVTIRASVRLMVNGALRTCRKCITASCPRRILE